MQVCERTVANLVHQVVAPEIAIPDAEKKPVLVITVQVFLELGFAGLKIADHADHDRVLLLNLEHPEVVLDPRTGFDVNGSNDSQR